ncbi:hypothetical protein skT53_06730 [Effusibacillus dendaii]|uniref:Uncharacterized protein n=1 Tax=Effusibacillus dendaii TaxID=2743772 RepID=A0A7I8D6A4_9BACL|nr:hypothetical protein skT53_06730 [Effusibacillus dendaii]
MEQSLTTKQPADYKIEEDLPKREDRIPLFGTVELLKSTFPLYFLKEIQDNLATGVRSSVL